MSTVIRVNDSTRRFWTTLPTHPVSLRLGWHIINKPADCQPRKKNSWQLNVCVDGEIGNNCWGEEGGEWPGIDVLDANAFECVIKSSDMVVICKADQLPTTRTLDEKKERREKKEKKFRFLSSTSLWPYPFSCRGCRTLTGWQKHKTRTCLKLDKVPRKGKRAIRQMKYRFGREKIKVLCTASTRFRRVLYSHAEPSEIFFFFFFFFKTEKRERPKTPLPLDPNILWLSFFSLLDLLLEKKAAATTSARAFGRLIHPCPALSLSFFSLSFIYIYILSSKQTTVFVTRSKLSRYFHGALSLSLSSTRQSFLLSWKELLSFFYTQDTQFTLGRCAVVIAREERRREEKKNVLII